jgi:hypothetical protein
MPSFYFKQQLILTRYKNVLNLIVKGMRHMYNGYNPYQYVNNFSPYNQNSIQQLEQMRDQLDARIQTAQQQQQQSQQQPMIPNQPTNLTQNFQLAPSTSSNGDLQCQYADNIDEVKSTFVMKNAIFVTKDLSTMWQKDVSGNIRTFKTEEIIPRDEKDMQIQALQQELDNMKVLMAQAIQQTSQPAPVEGTPVVKPKTAKK